MKNKGFTLIELLVVIAIIGTLTGLIVNNLADSRARARDAKRKAELKELKTSLRLYYNDYQQYPLGSDGAIMGCGEDANEACSSGGSFSAGAGPTIYMKQLPAEYIYSSTGGDSFYLTVTLENASDADLITSQSGCPGQSYEATDYVTCED